jgi:hypothetical protein
MAPRPKDALQKLQEDSAYSKTAGEVLDWTYYDTLALVSTTLMHRFFTVPLGQAGKTLADTNLTNGSQLPQGQNMKVHGLKACIVSAALATVEIAYMYNMLNSTTIEFIVPGKDSLGTWRLAEIMGSSFLVPLIPTTAGDNLPLNKCDFKPVFPLNFPIKIGAIQTFEVRMTHQVAPNAALDATKICFGLRGRLVRMA